MIKYSLKSDVWKMLYSELTVAKNIHVKNESQTRRFIEAIFYMTKEGCRWRALPPNFGSWRAIHKRYLEWIKKGIIDALFSYFSKDFDSENILIDSTIVRAHSLASGYRKGKSAEEGFGRSKGGFTTKIHAVTDALGLPLKFLISPGQRNDIVYAPKLLQDFENVTILGDKGYDSNELLEQLSWQKCSAVIPPKKNRAIQREIDRHTYKERHLIEIFFKNLKLFRRIATRYDKKLTTYQGFITFASILMWLK